MTSPFNPIKPFSSQITPIQPFKPGEADKTGGASSFNKTLMSALDGMTGQFNAAGDKIDGLMTGKVNNIHDVVVEGEKAGIMLKLATHIASKVCTACTTLFQMQI